MDIINLVVIIIFLAIIAISQIQKYIHEKKNIKNNFIEKLDHFCNKHYKKIWILFSIIIFFTVIFKFGELPTYIGVDEAGMAYDAYCIANYGVDRYLNSYPLYLTNFGGGQSVLFSYIAVLFIKILGPNIIAYRLPALLIYILGTIASYLFVSKYKDKKSALLVTFLIITCPWSIVSTRETLDCNLYAGMLMISLLLMNRAKRNYQYIVAGIIVGITLYTYCLSWITMPIFLAIWVIYMLYIKRINIKQIILLAIPIIILALPLIYFLLLNYGIVDKQQIGIFTFPILNEFRGNQIAISNIWKTGLESLQTIFFADKTIYGVYVPLFIIGYIIAFRRAIKAIRNREYTIESIMVIAFTTMLLGLLFTRIPTPNKANVLYIPILYFVSIAILEICKNSKLLFIISILAIFILFGKFEYDYYTKYVYIPNTYWYEDESLSEISKILKEDEVTNNLEKYVIVYKTSPYIYQLLADLVSPYDFSNSVETREYNGVIETTKVGRYNYINYFYNINELKNIDFKNNNNIVIVSGKFKDVIEYIKSQGYNKMEYKDLCILTNEKYNVEIDI